MKQLFIGSLLLFCAGLSAQNADENFPPPDNPAEIRAIRSTVPIRIDGILDEADWRPRYSDH